MMRGFAYISIAALRAGAALGQSSETLPAFEIADVQAVGRHITNVGSALSAVLCFSCVSRYLRARLPEPSDASITLQNRHSPFLQGNQSFGRHWKGLCKSCSRVQPTALLGKSERRKGGAQWN